MRTALHSLIFGLCLLSTSALSLAESGHYRWTDENGTVKYSDRPPEGIKAEFIKFSSSRPSKASEPDSTDQQTEDSATAGPRKLEALPAKDPQLCKQAQNNLKALQAARIRITEPDGSKRVLNEEEKEEQRENARKFIKVHC